MSLEDTEMIDTVADSGTTGHFFPNKVNKKNSHNEIKVICASNHSMESVATTALDIPKLSMKANTAYHFNAIMEQLLLSIPLLTDDGCNINLTMDNIVVTKNDKIKLKGIQDKISTLWMIPIKLLKKVNLLAQALPPVPMVYAENSTYHQPTIAKLMAYPNATRNVLVIAESRVEHFSSVFVSIYFLSVSSFLILS